MKASVQFSKYDRYKDSGVEWLGEIPEHWQTLRAKRIFRCISVKYHPEAKLLSVTQNHGVVPRNQLEQRVVMPSGELQTFKLVQKDNFVISLRSFQGGIEHSLHEGIVSPAYTVLKNIKNIPANYLKYLLKSHDFISEINKTVIGIRQGKNIDFENFSMSFLPVPEDHEADRIADFLDQKTTEIDAAIAKKKQLIQLLHEQKAILINRAVTKGLNPNVKMKDSGVSWIGKIPEHWKVKKLKFATKIFRGKFTHRPRNDPQLYDGKYPFIQTGDVARAGMHLSEYKQTVNEKGLKVSTLIPKGTVVITIAANIGDISILNFDACFPDSVVGFEPKQLQRDFLYYILIAMKQQFISSTTKNTQMNLNVDRIGNNFMPIPSKSEQKKIRYWSEKIRVDTEKLISLFNRDIEKLEEFKQTLITHTTTGKIKV